MRRRTIATMRLLLLATCSSALAVALAAGCLGQPNEFPRYGYGGQLAGSGGAGSGTGGASSQVPNAKDDGLPCEVSLLLVQYCRGCHSSPPIAGANTSLMTYQDLLGPLPSDPTKTLAQASLERMKSTTAPMPPGSLVPSAEVAPFAAWVAAGTPATACATDGNVPSTGTGPMANPYATAPVCTSNSFWNSGAEKSRDMTPGRACIACHSKPGGGGPGFLFSGTIYPTAHEPDDCAGIGGAVIEVTDKNGVVTTVTALASGNFYKSGDPTALATPIHARVLYNGKVLPMVTPVNTGDCNTCHTQNGKLGAPGRIILPP